MRVLRIHRQPSEALCATEANAIDAIARQAHLDPTFVTEQELTRPLTRLFLALVNDSIAAYLLSWHVADELNVLQIATAQDHRRQGLAFALMNEAIVYARQHQVRLVLLEVRKSNTPAQLLYRKLGFEVSGVRKDYYEQGEDAVEMTLTLEPLHQ